MFRSRTSSAITVCASLALCLLAAPASAAVIGFEGFDYTSGAPLSGQNGGSGWTGAWGAGNPLAFVATPGLSYGGLLTTGGAATATAKPVPPGGGDITFEQRQLASAVGADGTLLYLSVLMRPETGFGFYGGLNLGSLFLGKSGPSTTYGLESLSIASSSLVANVGETVLLVLRAQFLAGDDVFDLFVNPVVGGPEPLVSDATLSFDLGTTNLITINNAGAWTVDEIRLGTTYGDVLPRAVPAPAVAPLFITGLAAVALARWVARSRAPSH